MIKIELVRRIERQFDDLEDISYERLKPLFMEVHTYSLGGHIAERTKQEGGFAVIKSVGHDKRFTELKSSEELPYDSMIVEMEEDESFED